jgi:hypothetical protein
MWILDDPPTLFGNRRERQTILLNGTGTSILQEVFGFVTRNLSEAQRAY